MDEVKIKLDAIEVIEDIKDFENAASKCDNLSDVLENALLISVIVNRRETLFKQKKTEYQPLHNM
jgi:hypothetical protein